MTEKTRRSAGIIAEIYPSCAICKDHLAKLTRRRNCRSFICRSFCGARSGQELATEARKLLLCRGRSGHFLQARFPAIRGVAVNDPALGRFIDCRNECAKVFPGRFARNAHSPLERTQPCLHTPVVKRTRHRLSGALGCGLRISHSLRENVCRGWRLAARGKVVKMSILTRICDFVPA
jgi:hypothetical protein